MDNSRRTVDNFRQWWIICCTHELYSHSHYPSGDTLHSATQWTAEADENNFCKQSRAAATQQNCNLVKVKSRCHQWGEAAFVPYHHRHQTRMSHIFSTSSRYISIERENLLLVEFWGGEKKVGTLENPSKILSSSLHCEFILLFNKRLVQPTHHSLSPLHAVCWCCYFHSVRYYGEKKAEKGQIMWIMIPSVCCRFLSSTRSSSASFSKLSFPAIDFSELLHMCRREAAAEASRNYTRNIFELPALHMVFEEISLHAREATQYVCKVESNCIELLTIKIHFLNSIKHVSPEERSDIVEMNLNLNFSLSFAFLRFLPTNESVCGSEKFPSMKKSSSKNCYFQFTVR